MSKELPVTDINNIYEEISRLIVKKKNSVRQAVNDTMISLYWSIGEVLTNQILQNQKSEYGRKLIDQVSERLVHEFGKGFDRTTVFRMIKFYQEFSEFVKVATLSQQLTWSHFVELLPIEDELKRDFYAVMCKNENWSVRTLRERKKSMLYERTAISKRPEETIKNEIEELQDNRKMSLDMFYRDPYLLDFLGLKDTYSEKDLENAILLELENPIALILCAEKSQETIELLEIDQGQIHVGQYMTKMPPKELLEEKLSLAIANAKEQLSQRQ